MRGVGKNARMRTKPVHIEPEQAVKNYVSLIFTESQLRAFCHSGEAYKVGFRETWLWEELPHQGNHYQYTKVTCTGNSRFDCGEAVYEGPYGIWRIDLALDRGYPSTPEEAMKPCTRVWGKASCSVASDEWRETEAQRRARLVLVFEKDPGCISRGIAEQTRWTRLK